MTGTKAMAHSLKHAPTREEGERVVRLAFRVRRAERYICFIVESRLRWAILD